LSIAFSKVRCQLVSFWLSLNIDKKEYVYEFSSMFYITTPIPYVNGDPHLGHLLEGIFTDTMARFYKRVETDRVFLSMGVDQYGLKIYENAISAGQTPLQYAAEQTQKFEVLYNQFGIHHDAFVQTSSQGHKVVCQLVWKKLAEKGFIYKKSYTGLYCKGCEDFYASSQAINDQCPVHRTDLIQMNEENYFFKLSAFKEDIQKFLATGIIKPEYIAKEQSNFTDKLQDISISREKTRMPWGVDVPGDPSQVMYVWFDALLNYLTAVVDEETMDQATEFPYLAEEAEQAVWDEIVEAFPIDFMYSSKEIAKFHVVVFIGVLTGLGLPLPVKSLSHGLINDKFGHKFSKTDKNGVLPQELVEKFGIDGTRFVMMHEINVDGDTNFDWDTITNAYNSHLANNLGNLLMRVTTLIEKNYDGYVDLYEVYEKPYKFEKAYEHLYALEPKLALDVILDASRWGNELLEQTKPWTLIKEGKEKEAKEILTKLAVLLWDLSEVLAIFMPETAESIRLTITAEQITKAEPLFMKVELADSVDIKE
jgi:methionyl-tRNA synthetase